MPPSTIQQIIHDRIAAAPDRALSFAAVMDLALYHPVHGYYGRGPLHIGMAGDFFTAVSVGPLYGQLLALLAGKIWQSLGQPADFTIIEQGAHDGRLMEDVARGLETLKSPLAKTARFLIVEANEKYRAAQSARLKPVLGSRVSWADDVEALRDGPPHAFFITNELLDALPVHVVRWTGGEWMEWLVALSDDGGSFIWRDAPLTDLRLKDETDRLPRNLPPGYTTEIHPASLEWVRQVGRAAFRGVVLISDYGLEDDEYYSAGRTEGTLRRYFNHKTDGDVLQNLGDCDLTAHINFTRIMDEASPHFDVRQTLDQGRFLTHLAAPWLRSLDGSAPSTETAALLRQFQTLTHPGHMGDKFRICLLGRGMDAAPVLDLMQEMQPASQASGSA